MKVQILEHFVVSTHTMRKLGSGCFPLDCCKPRGIDSLQKQILAQTKDSTRYQISEEASVLLGLLEKDLNEVTACSIQTI